MRKRATLLAVLLAMLLLAAGCLSGAGGSGAGTSGKNGQAAKLTSIEELGDKKIGVLLGSVQDVYAMQHYPKATILQYKSPSDLLLAVKSGKVDAAFYTYEIMLDIARSNPDIGFLDENVFDLPIGMGFQQNNTALRQEFNAFLKQIQGNGVFDDMVDRWIKTGKTDMPAITNPQTNGVLTVGIVSDKGLPFAIVKDNRIVGFDVELVERFAAYQGKKLVLADMEFGSLIAAVSTNKVDMVASTLVITEERKKQIAFSDQYYPLHSSIFALKKNLAAYDGQDGQSGGMSLWQSLSQGFYSNIIHEQRYLLILDGLQTTTAVSLLATVFGTLLGALICFLRMSGQRLLAGAARLYINLIRGIPVLVLLMIIFYVVFASVNVNPVIAAVLAFGLNFAAYVSEMFRTAVESVDKGQWEAGIAGGFTRVQTFRHIILPQALQRVLPVYKGEFISLVKMTSVVGYIAVQDLTKAGDIIRSRTFDAFFPLIMVAVLYFAVAWLFTLVLDYAGSKSDPRAAGKRGGGR